MDRRIGTPSNVVQWAVAFEAGLGLLALLLGWLTGHNPWVQIDWSPLAVAIGVAASVPMLIALAAIIHSRWGWCARLRRVIDELVVPLFAGCGAGQLALISVLAGFGEELLFRGLIQGALSDWYSPALGLIAASLLFGLAHPLTIGYAAIVTMAGLYLGAVWLWSGNLLVPIVTHALYDFVALVYLARRRPQAAGSQAD